ncbi:MAG: VCBS repeat-containing protein [Planctomycetes bacterium]|nr:VCBS repeat-containing protein [Planctomycetota bacterium]
MGLPRNGILFLGLCLSAVLPGCYAGTAGVVLGVLSSSRGGDGNTPPVVSDLQVSGLRTSPAAISFVLHDAESDPVDAQISFTAADASGSPFLVGPDPSLKRLAASPRGTRHEKLWDFTSQVGGGFKEGLSVSVSIAGGSSSSIALAGLGNDPPRIERVAPPTGDETVGLADVALVVRDSSGDLASIAVEYRAVGDDSWRLAAPVRDPMVDCRGCLPGDSLARHPGDLARCPSCFAFREVKALKTGTPLIFVWDAVRDLGRTELEVELRVTPFDGVAFGDPAVSPLFRLDNNDPPTIEILDVAGPDRSFEVPVSYVVRDEEGDRVNVVLQWALENQEFPPPPAGIEDPDFLLELARSEEARFVELRGRHHLLSEAPLVLEGVLDDSSRLEPDEIREIDFVRRGLFARPAPLDGEPPPAPTPRDAGAFLLGREIRLIDPSGSVATRRIAAFDPATSVAKLSEPLPLRPAPGTRYELRANPDLASVSTTPGGLVHVFLWDSFRDLLGAGSSVTARVKLRAVAADPELGRESPPVFVEAGNQLLAQVQELRTSQDARAVAAVDLNADGRADVVVGEGRSRELSLFYHQSAAFGFPPEPGQRLPLGADPLALAPGDFNGDGRRDLLVLAMEGSLRAETSRALVYLQAADGRGLEPSPARVIPLAGTRPVAAAAGKLDEDDLDDVVIAVSVETVPDKLLIFLQAPGQGIKDVPGLELEAADILREVVLGDLDGDARADDIAAGAWEFGAGDERRGTVSIFLQEAAPAGPSRWRRSDMTASDSPRFLAIGDLDGQAPDDLVVLNEHSRTAEAYARGAAVEGAGEAEGWAAPVAIAALRTGPSPAALVVGDFNRDRRADVLAADRGSRALSAYLNRGAGSLSPDAALDIPTGEQPLAARSADFNLDGREDLVVLLGSGTRVYYQSHPGALLQDLAQRLKTERQPRSAAVGDVNGDGRADIAVVSQGSGTVGIHEQSEVGTLPESPGQTISTWRTPMAVSLGDVDGDGLLDVVVAGEDGEDGEGAGGFRVYSHAPGGPYREGAVLAVTGTAADVAVGDVDADGASEVLLLRTSRVQGVLGVYDRSPGGGLELRQETSVEVEPATNPFAFSRVLGVDDLDGDGRHDAVVLRSTTSGSALVYRQEGWGLELWRSLPTDPYPRALALGDLDGDGLSDLAVVDVSLDVRVFLREAGGAPGPSRRTSLRTFLPNLAVAIGDINGDGLADVLASTSIGQHLRFFLGTEEGDLGIRFQGDTSFPHQSWQLEGGALSLVLSDVNGDGRGDLLAALPENDAMLLILAR